MKITLIMIIGLCLAACGSSTQNADGGQDGSDAGADLGPAVLPTECLADPDCDVVFVSAHRGLCGSEPENTLAAFLECEQKGVPMLEIDTRETSDGFVVVMHDGDVIRTTDGETRFPGRTDVDQLTLAEFQTLVIDHDSCVDDPDANPDRCRPPTFAQVLERTGPQTVLDVDFKSGFATKLAGLVKDAGVVERILFFDSNLDNLRAYLTVLPQGIVMPRTEDAAAVDNLLFTGNEDLGLLWAHTDPWFAAEVKVRMLAAGVRQYFNGWDGTDPADIWILAAMAAEEAEDYELQAEYEEKARLAINKMINDGARALGSDFGPDYVQILYPDGFGR
ncbi:MAG: glycerophosphodiester phosphodiesterase family protein [Deltaproteobacteria bacterium]|nr:glycerophosphodiester phosphodiesterase family protein [Deltaproteobacteria bacterium]